MVRNRGSFSALLAIGLSALAVDSLLLSDAHGCVTRFQRRLLYGLTNGERVRAGWNSGEIFDQLEIQGDRDRYREAIRNVASNENCQDRGARTYTAEDERLTRDVLSRLSRMDAGKQRQFITYIVGEPPSDRDDLVEYQNRLGVLQTNFRNFMTETGLDANHQPAHGAAVFWDNNINAGAFRAPTPTADEQRAMAAAVAAAGTGSRAGAGAPPSVTAPVVATSTAPNTPIAPGAAPAPVAVSGSEEAPVAAPPPAHPVREAAGTAVNVAAGNTAPAFATAYRAALDRLEHDGAITASRHAELMRLEAPLRNARSPEERAALAMGIGLQLGITNTEDLIMLSRLAGHPERVDGTWVEPMRTLNGHIVDLGAARLHSAVSAGGPLARLASAIQHRFITPAQALALQHILAQLNSLRGSTARNAFLARVAETLRLTPAQIALLQKLVLHPTHLAASDVTELEALITQLASLAPARLQELASAAAPAPAVTANANTATEATQVQGTPYRCNETFRSRAAAFTGSGSRDFLNSNFCREIGNFRNNYASSCHINTRHDRHGRRTATEGEYNVRLLACRCQYHVAAGNHPLSRNPARDIAEQIEVGYNYGGPVRGGDTCGDFLLPWRGSAANRQLEANPENTTIRRQTPGRAASTDDTN